MDINQFSYRLSEITHDEKIILFRTDPEVLDFTYSGISKVIIETVKAKFEFEINRDNLLSIVGILNASLFDKDRMPTLLTWNFKSFSSYVRFHLGKPLKLSSSIVDLSVIEKFLGINKKCPENILEAINRSRTVSKNKDWKTVYTKVYLPLIIHVLPAMETTPLIDEELRQSVYAYYEIEGQTNGRLRCFKKFRKSYLPHTMGPDQKKVLKPRGYDLRFMCSDYRHCEVNVLQWLSGDENLKSIIESGKDVHAEIYHLVTGDECDTSNKRNMSKRIFLPVMYGCGYKTLAKNIGIPVNTSCEIVKRIYHQFPTAIKWMYSQQSEAKKYGYLKDYFGRPRVFKENFYLARNFVVQSVAATFCLEKLTALYKVIKNTNSHLCFSVHDSYGVIVNVREAKEVYDISRDILQSPSDLCDGLSMQVETKFGLKLDKMRVLWKN